MTNFESVITLCAAICRLVGRPLLYDHRSRQCTAGGTMQRQPPQQPSVISTYNDAPRLTVRWFRLYQDIRAIG